MQEASRQPVVIENKPRANGIVASEFVAGSTPNGYTLLIGASGPMTINPALYPKLPYNPVRDFEPVTIIGSFRSSLRYLLHRRTLGKRVVQIAKSAPTKLNYGAGSAPFRFAAELFRLRTGTEISHVPYKGSAQTINAMLANEVQMAFVKSGTIVPHIKASKLRRLQSRRHVARQHCLMFRR